MSEAPNPADVKNGENLMLIKDRRIAVSYMIEALRIFDHYHFRVAQQNAKKANRKLQILKPQGRPRRRLGLRRTTPTRERSAIENCSASE